MIVEVLRRAQLLDNAPVEHRDTRSHGHGFRLVMHDIDKGGLHALVDLEDLRARLHAQLGIQVGERLVQQEHLRRAHQCTAQRVVLALPTGRFFGLALEQLFQPQDIGRVLDTLLDVLRGNMTQIQAERHVVVDGHVRIEGIVLEDHRNVVIFGIHVIDDLVHDVNLSLGDFFQPRDHAQARALATPGGADQDEELFVLDIHRDIVDHFNLVEALVDVLEFDIRHEGNSFSPP